MMDAVRCAACSRPARRSTCRRPPRPSAVDRDRPSVSSGSNSRPTGSAPAPARTPRPAPRRPFPDQPRSRCGLSLPVNAVERDRPLGRCQDHSMFRYHALGGVSLAAIQLVLLAPIDVAIAQNAGTNTLPPVTVEAPVQRQAVRPARKPQRTASASRRNRPVATPSANSPAGAERQLRRERVARDAALRSRGTSCRNDPSASPQERSTRRSTSRTPRTPSNTCRACSCASATTATTRRCWRREAGGSIPARGR